jgi:hypothetical protein
LHNPVKAGLLQTLHCNWLDAPSPRFATRSAAISQSHLQRQFNELILVRVAAFGEGLEDLREKKEL